MTDAPEPKRRGPRKKSAQAASAAEATPTAPASLPVEQVAKEGETDLSLKGSMVAYLGSLKKEWAHDRSKSLGASECFGCIREAWFKKRGAEFGFEKDDDALVSTGAAERGNLIENHYVVPALKDGKFLPFGAATLGMGDEQKTFFSDSVSATPDGLIYGLADDALAKNYGIPSLKALGGDDSIVIEIKSIDPRITLREAKARHEGQAGMQLGIIREKTDFRPAVAIIIYIDASFLDEIDEFVIHYDPNVYAAGKSRAATLFETDDPAELMAEGRIDGTCKTCDYDRACRRVSNAMVPEEDVGGEADELTDQLYPLIAEYIDRDRDASEAEDRAKEIKEQIKQILANANRNKIANDRIKVRWTRVKGRKTFQQKLAKEAGVDLEPYMKESEGYDKLTLDLT